MISIKYKLLLIISLLLPMQILANPIDNLNIKTENYPPFNYIDNNNTLKGISIDLLSLMLERVNSKLTTKDIKLLPWARAYKLTLKDKNGMVFSTMRTWQREREFKWVGPISTKTVVLLSKKDKNIKLHSLKGAKKYRIGVALDDIGEVLLRNKGLKLDKVGGLNAMDTLIKKINFDRIDLLAYSYPSDIIHDAILDRFEVVYKLKEDGLYFAFNNNVSDEIIEKFQSALDQIKKEPTYQKIIDKYLNY